VSDWLSKITAWLADAFRSVVGALFDVVSDALLFVLDALLQGIAGLLAMIPAPAFLQNNSLGTLLAHLPPEVLYFAGHFRLAECFALLGASVVFRLSRKVATAFQW